ncbi:MAG: hypothetical protein ACOZBH_01880 [Patescibacteria group bacterium]
MDQKNMESRPARPDEELSELPAEPEKLAQELAMSAETEKKEAVGFFRGLFGRGKWQKKEQSLAKLEAAQQAVEQKVQEFKQKTEEILSADQQEKKGLLDTAREKFVEAARKLKKYEGLRGCLRRLRDRFEAADAINAHQEAKHNYIESRAEFVGDSVEKHLKESMALADKQAEAFAADRGWGRKFYDSYKKLGEWNLTKLGWEPKGRIGRLVARAASVRTAISLGLLAGGSVLAATGAAAAAGGIFVARRALGGLGAGVGSYDLMKMVADRKLSGEVNDDKLKQMPVDEIRKRLEYFEAAAPLSGKKPSEIDFYNKLAIEYSARIKSDLSAAEHSLKTEAAEPPTSFENIKDQEFDRQKNQINSLLVRELKLMTAGLAQKERAQKAQGAAKAEAERSIEWLAQEMDKLGEEMIGHGRAAEMIIEFLEKNNLVDNPALALRQQGKDFALKPEYDMDLEEYLKADNDFQKMIESAAMETFREVAAAADAERKRAAERAMLIQTKLSQLAAESLNDIDRRRKKSKKNNRLMKGIAAGVGVFVGSGGTSWLMKNMFFEGEAHASEINGENMVYNPDYPAEALPQFPLAEAVDAPKIPVETGTVVYEIPAEQLPIVAAPPADSIAVPALEIKSGGAEALAVDFEAPEMVITPLKAVTALKPGEGILSGINRILNQDPDLKNIFNTPAELRRWKIGQLKNLGFEMKGSRWISPVTVHEGDQVEIIKRPDGSLDLQVTAKPAAALSPEEYLAKQRIREFMPPRKLKLTEPEKLKALLNRQLEWAFSEKGPMTLDEEMTRQLEWAFSEKGPKTFNEEMRGQLERWFTGPESKTVPDPGLDSKIAAAKPAGKVAAESLLDQPIPDKPAAEELLSKKIPSKPSTAMETVIKPKSVAAAAPEAVGRPSGNAGPIFETVPGVYGFNSESIAGGRIIVKPLTGGGYQAFVEGQVKLSQADLVKKGVLAKDFQAKLLERYQDRAPLIRQAVEGVARRIYLHEEALRIAKAQGNKELVNALKKTVQALRLANYRRFGNLFA